MCEVIRSQKDSSLSPSLSLSGFLSYFLSCQGLLREAHPHTPSSCLCFFLSPSFSPLQGILGVLYSFTQDQLLLPVHELLGETMATTLKFSSNVGDLNKTQIKQLMQRYKFYRLILIRYNHFYYKTVLTCRGSLLGALWGQSVSLGSKHGRFM